MGESKCLVYTLMHKESPKISLKKVSRRFDFDLLELPFTYRILVENLVRNSENEESLEKIVTNIKK